jgi:hypothetical protein
MPALERVEHGDVMAREQEAASHDASDVSGPTGDERAHEAASLDGSRRYPWRVPARIVLLLLLLVLGMPAGAQGAVPKNVKRVIADFATTAASTRAGTPRRPTARP